MTLSLLMYGMRIEAGKQADKCSPIIYWTFFTIELSAKRAKRCLILITWQPYRHFLPLRVIPNDDYQFLKGEPQDLPKPPRLSLSAPRLSAFLSIRIQALPSTQHVANGFFLLFLKNSPFKGDFKGNVHIISLLAKARAKQSFHRGRLLTIAFLLPTTLDTKGSGESHFSQVGFRQDQSSQIPQGRSVT